MNLILLFMCFAVVFSRIEYYELKQDYSNVNVAQNYYLTFSVSSEFKSTNYIKVIMPISLGTPTAAWTEDVVSDFPAYEDATITESTIAGETNSYFLKLYDANGDPAVLDPDTPYKVKLTADAVYGGATGQTSENVKIYVTSSTTADHIIIDANPAFSPLYFTAAPTPSVAATLTRTSAADTVDSLQTYRLDFTVAVATTGIYRADITLDDESLQITDDSIDMNAGYNCVVSAERTQFICRYFGDVDIGDAISIEFEVQTPVYPVTANVLFKSVQDYYQDIKEEATPGTQVEAVGFTWAANNYLTTIAWGISTETDATVPTCIRLYENGPTETQYNTIRFSFTVASDLPSSNYKVLIDLDGSSGAITNSMVTNLPVHSSADKVICRADAVAAYCENVGDLDNGDTYYIAVKVTLPNGAGALGGNFGNVEIYATDPLTGDYATGSIVEPARADYSAGLLTNSDKQIAGVGPIRTWPASSTSGASGDGVKPGDIGTVEFHADTLEADFDPSSFFTDNTAGIEIFTNAAVLGITNNPASCNSDAGTVNTGHVTICTTQTFNFQGSTALRFRLSFGASNDDAFAGYLPFQFTYAATYPQAQQASYVADEESLDVYFAAVPADLDQATDYVPTVETCYMMNGISISQPGTFPTGTIDVLVSNIWTGSGVNYLTGKEFPAFIQVKGQLNSADYDSDSEKIVLFFTGLDPFQNSDFDTTNQVGCGGTKDVECYYYAGADTVVTYYDYPRIELFTDFDTNEFTFLIPVATQATIITYDLVIGIAESHPDLSSDTSLGFPQMLYEDQITVPVIASSLVNLFEVENADLNNEEYYLETDGKMAGEIGSATVSANHIDVGGAFSPNGASKSALFAWTTNYDFLDHSANPSIEANFANGEDCVYYTYYYAADEESRYGFACPVNDDLALPATPTPEVDIDDFIYPSNAGTDMPVTYSTLSSNSGFLTEFVRDSRTEVMDTNLIESVELNPVLYQGEKGMLATLNIETTNILPQDSIVKMVALTTVPWQFSMKNGPYCAVFQDAVPDLTTQDLPGNCDQNYDDYNLIFTINADSAWTSTSIFIVIYQIDIIDQIVFSSQSFWLATYTAGEQPIDNTTSISPAIQYLTQQRSFGIKIESISFLSDTQNTRSQIIANILTSDLKPLTRFDFATLKFWNTDESVGETFECVAYDEGLDTTELLRVCDVRVPYVSIQPHYDLAGATRFTIRLKSFKNPTSETEVTFHHQDLSGTFSINSTQIFTYPTQFSDAPGFTEYYLQKRFNTYIMKPEYIFTFRIPTEIDLTMAIILRFPSVYSADNIQHPLLCKINNFETNCFINNPQEITIQDFPISYPADRLFRLLIVGLNQAEISKAYRISVVVAKKLDSSAVLYHQEIEDIVPQTSGTFEQLVVTDETISSTYSLEKPTLTLGFQLNGAATGLASRSLIIDFPNRYGQVLHNTTVAATVTDENSNDDIWTGDVTFRLSRIEILLPATPTLTNQADGYSVTLVGVPTPFLEIDSQIIDTMAVTDADRSTIVYQSFRGIQNARGLTEFTFNPEKQNLLFGQVNQSVVTDASYSKPFIAFAGIASLEFQLKLNGDIRFDRTIIMDPTDAGNTVAFESTPDVLNSSSGLLTYTFSITFDVDAAPGFYHLRFNKIEQDPASDENTDLYSLIPPLLIQLISERRTIEIPSFFENTLSLAENGNSFPVTFDLSLIRPPNELKIVAYIPPTSDIEIDYEEFTQITLTTESPIGSFTLQHTSGGTPDVSETTLSFYLDGQDKDLYNIEQTVLTVKLISLEDNIPPNMTGTLNTAAVNETGFTVDIESDQVSQLYYQIVGSYGTTTDVWGLQESTVETLDLSFTQEMVRLRQYYFDDQFNREDEFYGVWNYETINSTTTFSFDGLRSGTQYFIRIWAVNLKGDASDPFEANFTTLVNTGSRSKIAVVVDRVLENRQMNKISCWLAVRYRLPLENVLDFQGFTCNDHRINPPDGLDTLLSSQHRVLQQDNGDGTYTYTFYLYPLSFFAVDDSYTNALADTTIAADLQTFVDNWPYTSLVVSSVTLTQKLAPATDDEAMVSLVNGLSNVVSGNESVTAVDLALNQAGFIWLYALQTNNEFASFSDFFFPSKNDYKYYLNRKLYDENYVGMRYYDGSNAVNITFRGLKPGSDYILYAFGQNDDSGDLNITSLIYAEQITTSSGSLISCSFVVLLMLIALLFDL